MTAAQSNKAAVFEQMYIALRDREGRVYPDEIVSLLPIVPAGHHLEAEWKLRQASASRLLKHLKTLPQPGLKVLEVGCGNGWLCGQLASLANSSITGIDVNRQELEQAKRVFASKQNLKFMYGDLRHVELEENFDVIIFAASIQYFSSISEIMDAALRILSLKGEIHILDSHFYDDAGVEPARERSANYFRQMGFPGLADYYFQHSLSSLNNYHYKLVEDPSSIPSRLFKRPFHWVKITKHEQG